MVARLGWGGEVRMGWREGYGCVGEGGALYKLKREKRTGGRESIGNKKMLEKGSR